MIAGKLSSLKQAFVSNARTLKASRKDFLESCTEYADELRVRKDLGTDEVALGRKILEDCGNLKRVRNHIIDWILLEGSSSADDFQDSLIEFLETLCTLKARPDEIHRWNQRWFEAHSVFVYETFLYIIASLLKEGAYILLNRIFTSNYLKPKSERYSANRFADFSAFFGHSEALQAVLSPEGQRFLSPAAELLRRQADRSDINFSEVMQAELLVTLMALIRDVNWFPQTLYYQSELDFPFFIRATQHRHFVRLSLITGVEDADELRRLLRAAQEKRGVAQWSGFSSFGSFWEWMNMEKLDTLS